MIGSVDVPTIKARAPIAGSLIYSAWDLPLRVYREGDVVALILSHKSGVRNVTAVQLGKHPNGLDCYVGVGAPGGERYGYYADVCAGDVLFEFAAQELSLDETKTHEPHADFVLGDADDVLEGLFSKGAMGIEDIEEVDEDCETRFSWKWAEIKMGYPTFDPPTWAMLGNDQLNNNIRGVVNMSSEQKLDLTDRVEYLSEYIELLHYGKVRGESAIDGQLVEVSSVDDYLAFAVARRAWLDIP